MPRPAAAGLPARGSAPTRAGAVAVLIGVVAALLAVLATPGTTPPLYNGLGFPDEPYRWLNPPAGSPSTPKWTSAGGTLGVTDGVSDSGSFMSAEQGPQVAYFADPGAFRAPEGASGVKVDASAVSTPGAAPAGATMVSNVYRFSATPVGASGSLDFAEGKKFLVNLRANKATDRVVLLHRWDGSRWQQRATFQVGTEIYAGTVSTLGDYALFTMAPGTTITVQHSDPSPLPATTGAATTGGGARPATTRATASRPAAATSGSASRTATTRASATTSTTSGTATSGTAAASTGAADDDGSLSAGEQPGVVPGLVQPDKGVSSGALWWVIAAVAAALAAGLVGLRVLLARRARTAGSPPAPDPR